MALSSRTTWSGLVAILALIILHFQPTSAQGSTQLYCSDQNTGDAGGVVSEWEFQSQGNCKGNCSGNAFAIVQWDKCWCSNYIPADQTDVGDCNESCPGYPDDKCGSRSAHLFGYYDLSHKPSGTQGASNPSSTQPSSAPPSSASSTEDPKTIVQTTVVVVTPSQESTAAPTTMSTSVVSEERSSSSSSAASSTAVENPSSNIPSTTQQAPSSSVVVTTINGVVSTRVIIYTPTNIPSPAAQNKGTPVGAIAGGVVGGVLGIAAIVAGVIFLLWRRRKQQQEGEDFQSGVTRNTSTMSKSGLLRTEKTPRHPPPVATGSHRSSRMMPDNESISPISGSDRRNSRPYLFDQRMNPSAIMSMDNHSRGSFVSMDDARDYGRTLNVRNPDPDPR